MIRSLKRQVASALFVVLSLSAAAHAAPPSSGIEPLMELLKSKGIISAEDAAAVASRGDHSRSDLKGVIELLRSKGAITDAEAVAILGQMASQPDPNASRAAEKTPETVAEVRNDSPAGPPIPDEELRPTIEMLREQGVIGVDEAAQILERVGRTWSPAEEDDIIAPLDQEIEYGRTTLPREGLMGDITQLQRQKLITIDEADRIRKRFVQKLALERVTSDIGEDAKREIRSQVEARIPSLPEWTRRVKVGGDLRLRYQGDFFDEGNSVDLYRVDKPNEQMNTTVDRHRLRIRARLAVTAKVNDELEAGIGLASGNTTDPVSTNQTLGDSLNKKNILLDLAYMKWTPDPALSLLGGRFASPWFSTDLVWDPDVNFDGVAVSYRPQLSPRTSLFMTAGAFPIQEVELSTRDKWLFGGQLGIEYREPEKVSGRLGVAIYSFENTEGRRNSEYGDTTNDYTAPQFVQKGNTYINIGYLEDSTGNRDLSKTKLALASEYRELNFTGQLDLGFWHPVHVLLSGDYVKNIGYDHGRVNELANADRLLFGDPAVNVLEETDGYQVGITVGHQDTRESGRWKALLSYKYLESDAVMDAFTDSDFHLGGTNAKGWIVGGDFGVARDTWLSARWLTANEISGPPLGIDVFQFNVNARF